jgi:hypothetical protein
MSSWLTSHLYVEWAYAFKETMFHSWWDKITNFFAWIVKSIQYSIVLWSDRDWDWVFILILLKYKLSRIRKHIVEHDFIMEAEKIGADIYYVEHLLRRLIENDYCHDEYEAHHQKWGSPKIVSKDIGNGFHELVCISCEKAIEINKVEEEREEIRAIFDRDEELEKKDWDELWNYMNKNLKNWWC